MSGLRRSSEKTVIVVGGGVAGMSAACALAETGLRVQLVERRSYLGGLTSSLLLLEILLKLLVLLNSHLL